VLQFHRIHIQNADVMLTRTDKDHEVFAVGFSIGQLYVPAGWSGFPRNNSSPSPRTGCIHMRKGSWRRASFGGDPPKEIGFVNPLQCLARGSWQRSRHLDRFPSLQLLER
jgi:hypothetical protein